MLSPAILCLSEDIPGPLTATLIQAAKRQRIPSTIAPYTIPNEREALEYCYSNPGSTVRSPEDEELAAALPRWIVNYKGRPLLRMHSSQLIASEYACIAPPQPFIVNSGYADKILVESERMLEVYRRYSFPEKQLALTGSAADDMLHAGLSERSARREALYRRLNLPASRPLLLSALVPNQLARPVPLCEFNIYADLVEFWVRTIAACGDKYNVVLKISPRDRREDLLHLEKFGIAIAPDDMVDLVPLADVFVASVSSTIRWAVACGIPCINYDVYHYR
jgi:hypothetical protein